MATRNHRENCGICHAITCEHTRAARAIQEAVNLLNQPTQDHPPPDPRDAEIAALKAEVETAKAWQGAAVLRNYDAVHILIEEIGAPGPENVDETARRAVTVIRALRRALAAGPAALLKKGGG